MSAQWVPSHVGVEADEQAGRQAAKGAKVWHGGGAPCTVRALCEKLAVFHHRWLDACHGSQGPEFCTPQPLLSHQEFDHACFCRWVVFRDVPGINTVIIGAVRKRPLGV